MPFVSSLIKYMNENIHWNQIYSNGIEINDDTILNTLLFTDYQVLLSDSDDLQRALYTLHNTTKHFWNENISTKIYNNGI